MKKISIVETAFPEAAERVLPTFHVASTEREPLLRWVAGIERPIAYAIDEGLLGADALRGIGLSRGQLHERALEHVRATVPEGFAPSAQPAYLDDGAAALLVLPSIVPPTDSWLAYPTADGTLVVLEEGAASTEDELRRLATERTDADPFARPVRVRARGFESADWPEGALARTTDPGFATPDAPKLPRGAKTVTGDAFQDDVAARVREIEQKREEEEP